MVFFKKLLYFISSRALWINVVLIVLFWVGIIWGGLSYFESYTEKGARVMVPTFVNNNIKDVPSLIGERDLKYEIIDSVYNPNLVEGTVIFQDPAPTDSSTVLVKPGRVMKFRVSKQTRLVEVPLVVSKSRRFAETSLVSKGLRTRTTFVPSNEDQGSVIDQRINGKSVKSGTKVSINTVVELIVGERTGSELTLVPNLLGLTINEAKERLKASQSLRLFAVYNACENKADSLSAQIENQTPVAGDSSMVPAGSTITVFATPQKATD